MKIWIDITNAPQVRFFKDIIKYFQDEDEDLIITTRQFGDIHKLINMYDFDFISVGKHGIKSDEKLKESATRVNDLIDIVTHENIDIALSKHSVELPRVSFGLGIPSVYILDNEHAEKSNKLSLPLCDRIIVPKIIDIWKLIAHGADPNKLIRYNGTSEILHFKTFKYNENIFNDMNLNLNAPKTILMRTEPSHASYLNVNCNVSVLSPIVDVLKDYANILILTRFKEQADIFEGIKNVTILKPPLDTLSIIKRCDLIIGAGGTMNREAAILNTPVISCFPGDHLSVDQFYINRDLMFRSNDTNEIINKAMSFLVKHKNQNKIQHDDLFQLIIDNVYDLAENS